MSKKFITNKLHEKICRQLSEVNYKGILSYSGFNEPMLNKNIYKNLKQAKNFLPLAKIELVTNGDVLNIARLKKKIHYFFLVIRKLIPREFLVWQDKR